MKGIEFVATNYLSDLTDEQWGIVSGEQWVQMACFAPRFPSHSMVHTFYRRARISGLLEKVLDAIVEKLHMETGKILN